MSRTFTINDIDEIKDAGYIVGVEAIWCRIRFKGCTNFVDFYTAPDAKQPLGRELYTKFKAGEYGEVTHGLGGYRTLPKEQHEVEEVVIAKRNQLLFESDWVDLPSSQGRLNDSQKTAWASYRQALRDLTTQPTFPWDPVWPSKP